MTPLAFRPPPYEAEPREINYVPSMIDGIAASTRPPDPRMQDAINEARLVIGKTTQRLQDMLTRTRGSVPASPDVPKAVNQPSLVDTVNSLMSDALALERLVTELEQFL